MSAGPPGRPGPPAHPSREDQVTHAG